MFVCCVSEETTAVIMAPKRVSLEPDVYNGMATFDIVSLAVYAAETSTSLLAVRRRASHVVCPSCFLQHWIGTVHLEGTVSSVISHSLHARAVRHVRRGLLISCLIKFVFYMLTGVGVLDVGCTMACFRGPYMPSITAS